MRKNKVGENHLAIVDEYLNRARIDQDMQLQAALVSCCRRVVNPREAVVEFAASRMRTVDKRALGNFIKSDVCFLFGALKNTRPALAGAAGFQFQNHFQAIAAQGGSARPGIGLLNATAPENLTVSAQTLQFANRFLDHP